MDKDVWILDELIPELTADIKDKIIWLLDQWISCLDPFIAKIKNFVDKWIPG